MEIWPNEVCDSRFYSEVEITGADVLSNVPRHLQPPVILRD